MIKTIGEYQVEIVRSKRAKRMLLKVSPPFGTIKVTLPYRMSDKGVESFVLKNKAWIERGLKRYTRPIDEISYLDGGASFKLYGTVYQIVEVENSGYTFNFVDDKVMLGAPNGTLRATREVYVKTYLKTMAKYDFERRVAKWEPIIGVKSKGITIRFMTSRWGSCDTKTHRLTFNALAVQNGEDYLDYLVCHELLHIIYPNHGKEFKTHLKKLIPDMERHVRLPIK